MLNWYSIFLVPGVVSNLTWSGTKNSVLLEWGVPKKNPQCVEGYQVLWNNKETLTKDTYVSLNSLRPCTRILASVKALPNSISDLHESEIRVFVYTDVVGKTILVLGQCRDCNFSVMYRSRTCTV